jgi:hypothetical protein
MRGTCSHQLAQQIERLLFKLEARSIDSGDFLNKPLFFITQITMYYINIYVASVEGN